MSAAEKRAGRRPLWTKGWRRVPGAKHRAPGTLHRRTRRDENYATTAGTLLS